MDTPVVFVSYIVSFFFSLLRVLAASEHSVQCLVLNVPIFACSLINSVLWKVIIFSMYFSLMILHYYLHLIGKQITHTIALGHFLTVLYTCSYMFSATYYNKELIKQILSVNADIQCNSKRKSDFLNVIGHELRTPASAIVGYAELLLQQLQQRPSDVAKLQCKEQNNYLEMILAASNTVVNSLNSILQYSSLETGPIVLQRNPIDLVPTITRITKMVQPYESTIALHVTFDNYFEQHKKLIIDAPRFEQVVINLLSNAYKFTKKGTISLHVSKQNSNSFLLTLQDTGCGIPDSVKSKVFTPFSQQDLSLSRQYEGLGLGLAACKAIIDAMHGNIWFESKEHMGTTFFVELPLEEAEVTLEQSCQSSQLQQQISILIVDDNCINVKVLSKMLRQFNISHSCVYSALEAIEQVKSNRFDLILMDVQV
jgi:signal transduction histidine kinase